MGSVLLGVSFSNFLAYSKTKKKSAWIFTKFGVKLPLEHALDGIAFGLILKNKMAAMAFF